jgi:zinc protease
MSTDDSPTDYLAELLNAEAFVAHPYHAPIIGWMTDLDHLTREDVYRHYKQYYIPNNATIVAAGDFKSADLLEQIRKAFESIPAGEKIPPVQITEPEQKGERRFVVRKPAQIPAVMIGFKAPNFKDADHFPLTVLSTILSSGKSSRLYQQLVYEKKIALEVESDYSELSADPSLFTFAGKPQQGKTAAELETAILTEIEKVRSDRCGEEEIQKAKNLIETQFILSRDSNFFVAMQLGTAASVGAGTRYFDHYIESIRAVSADDIQRVARKYLIADSRTTGILEPVSDSAPGKD